jgi:hypothetical protein
MSLIAWSIHYSVHRAIDGEMWARVATPLIWRWHIPHHDSDPKVNRSKRSEALEMLVTSIAAGLPVLLLLLFVPEVRGCIHPAIAVLFFVVYSSGHMINYHYMWSNVHAAHHANVHTNFSPNWVDLLAGTSKEIEDLWHVVPNTAACTAAGIALALALSRWCPSVTFPAPHWCKRVLETLTTLSV